ncbi:EAL domain-containing protein [Oryzomonas sagensis]|uniref:EAL domain-containing protein n=1 Tax=Oryzomonas sagensis TaxID=2603857 RepID=A0ABQ6TS31_9BACT|nr:EAL domain-containing protein [Oryzomonas sagensis]KAB0671725.1 EAL domain-containing protein [Oryzomonas sagensis]
MNGPSLTKFFLGRQPILNIRQEIVGYELLFRSTEKNYSEFESQDQASMSVISSAMANFGFRNVLGDKDGFINVTHDVLFSDMVEVLPPKQTILELLESVELTGAVKERCSELKAKNFRIALDDHIYSPDHHDLYSFVDIVKIDLLETDPVVLHEAVAALRQFPLTLLAERIETQEQFQDCLELGFELFQGYFFERPVVLKRKGLEPSKMAMLRLLGYLKSETDFGKIEEVFRDHPELSYNLLKLVNSVHLGLREKIKSLRHAIMLLGLGKLRRWVQLAIFASADSRGVDNPLLEMAAVRGRLLEYLVMERYHLPRGSEQVEAAFMLGILSLVDVLFETSVEGVVRELQLNDEISAALINREGKLGGLLALAETLEQTNFGEVTNLTETCGIPIATLLTAQLDAFNWRTSISEDKEPPQ